MSVPLLADALRRRESRRPQAELRASERRREVRGVFEPRRDEVRGMSVLLVDDVITTGSTVREAAGVLRAAGARRVDALALLAAEPPRTSS